jgi:hypothetical protein
MVRHAIPTILGTENRVIKHRRREENEENGVAVRPYKAPFSGCNSRPASFAPAGSNRSGAGGNEIAEAFAAKDR